MFLKKKQIEKNASVHSVSNSPPEQSRSSDIMINYVKFVLLQNATVVGRASYQCKSSEEYNF